MLLLQKFNVSNMSFKAIRESKSTKKISTFYSISLKVVLIIRDSQRLLML